MGPIKNFLELKYEEDKKSYRFDCWFALISEVLRKVQHFKLNLLFSGGDIIWCWIENDN